MILNQSYVWFLLVALSLCVTAGDELSDLKDVVNSMKVSLYIAYILSGWYCSYGPSCSSCCFAD